MKLLLPIHRPLSVVITHARKRHNDTHDISHIETIIVTSKNSRPPKTSVSTPHWIRTFATALWGIAARKLRHIRPHGNFMLSGVLRGLHITDPLDYCCLSSSIMNRQMWRKMIFSRKTLIIVVYHHQSWINDVCLSSIMIVLINEWWIIAYQSSIISPWLPYRNWGSFVLVERCICVCGSWCGRLCPALWWKDRHIQSKEPWSSFTSHAITHFLYICRL